MAIFHKRDNFFRNLAVNKKYSIFIYFKHNFDRLIHIHTYLGARKVPQLDFKSCKYYIQHV